MASNAGSNARMLGFGALAASAIGILVVVMVPPNRPAPQQGMVGDAATVADVPEEAEGADVAAEPAETNAAAGDAPADSADTAEIPDTTEAAMPAVVPPVREEFLMFPDGFATIAGKTTPGVAVDVVLDGATLERVTADAQGNFGATLFIEPSDQPRVMRLIADPDGAAIASPETYFVQPMIVATADASEAGEGAAEGAEETEVAAATDVASGSPSDTTETTDDAAPDNGSTVVAVAGDATDETAPTVVETATASNGVETAGAATTAAETGSADAADATNLAEGSALSAGNSTDTANDTTTDQTAAPENGAVTTPAAPDTVAADAGNETAEDVVAATDTEASETADTATGEASSPAVLVADADGVRVLQPALSDQSPEVMSNVALDTITYDEEGEVLIAGRASGEGFVQVYLDNQPITTTLIGEQGAWRTDLPNVDTGVYTLRIDEVTAEGDVISRIETPFQREEAETVAAVFAEDTADETFEVAVRTVQPGSTLWAIAREQFGSGIMYVEVFEANRDLIRDPDLIYPGQVFRMPDVNE